MGLCKCPKKKVTNQFCFEHRVNVCETCLVSGHPRCIVKSYLNWLQDSDYNPVCTLCNGNLSEGEVIRFVCYDLFHWDCINSFASSLPDNTAPAGFTCPNCRTCIFPPENLVSPVCDVLKKRLATANWARAGLGLPVIQNNVPQAVPPETQQTEPPHNQEPPIQISNTGPRTIEEPTYTEQPEPKTQHVIDIVQPDVVQHTSVGSPIQSAQLRSDKGSVATTGKLSSKLFDTREEETEDMSVDHDVDKYKRRGALDWFSRWFGIRSRHKSSVIDPNAQLKRATIMMVLLVIGLLTVIVLFTQVGRSFANKDPFLDPMSNPNIRVQQQSNIQGDT